MNLRLAVCALLALVLIAGTGCYSTQEGGVRAGVPFAKDTISSRYEVPWQRVRDAAREVLRREGQLTNDDSVTFVLQGVVNNRKIWIKIDNTDPRITQINIQARSKSGAADVDMASEIDKQIYGVLLTTAP